MIEHFDSISQKYYDFVDRLWYDARYFHERELETTKSFVESVQTGPILDAGCGPGRHSAAILERGRWVVAVDFSIGMLEQVRKRLPISSDARLDLVRADVRALPFRSGAFSGAVSMEVLEHMPHDEASIQALRELSRCTRDGGLSLVEVPLRNHESLTRLLRKRPSWKQLTNEEWRKYYEEHPIVFGRLFPFLTARRLVARAGLTIVGAVHVRVVPSGWIEMFPKLAKFDEILERLPGIRGCAREVIWTLRADGTNAAQESTQ